MKTFLSLVLTLAFAASAYSSEAWSTDFAASMKSAESANKPLLALFTGKDWCPPCKMLEKETLSQDEFLKFAKSNLQLVELDFPRSTEPSKENQEAAQKYKIEGFPTVILFDAKGKELARNVGYLPGGPSAFIAWVEKYTK